MMIESLTTSFLYKLLAFGKVSSISFDENLVHIYKDGIDTLVKFEDFKMIRIENKLLWNDFELILKDGAVYKINGFNKRHAVSFHQLLTKYFANYYYTYFYNKAQKVLSSYPLDNEYFQERHFNDLVEVAKTEMEGFAFLDELENSKFTIPLTRALNLSREDHTVQKEHNNNFLRLEQENYKRFFDTIEKNPLTEKQREAVLVNEKANLVIAGAGSGKTSVMIARVGYILNKYKVNPDEILVLAFANDASKELRVRIKERLDIDNIGVTTFHAFGQSVIAQVEGQKPTLAKWAGNDNLKSKLIEEILLELSERDNKFKKTLLNFFAYPFSQYRGEFDFKSKIEHQRYLEDNKIISLKGERVKSYEECEIANFLFLNGIEYEYESTYKHDTATVEYRQYEPDFYLTEYDIYLEHFGVDRRGNTAPFVDKTNYQKGMEWKRELHKSYNTTLIETYSYFHQEGRLLQELENILQKENVEFSPKAITEALSSIENDTHISNFSKTVASFVGHYKSNSRSIPELREKANNSERLNAFLDLFDSIFFAYESIKKSKKVIDFEDMINMAIEYIESHQYLSKYKYILVDEYQDISTVRARFVKALYDQLSESVLTVVGDDWQSIFRFTGSEISLFHNFEKYFGVARKVQLDYTFRFNNKISSVSQKFIESNPSQIKKDIKTLTSEDKPMVHVWWGDDKDLNKIKEILSNIQSSEYGSVYILGRNKYAYPDDIKSVKELYPTLDIDILSVHKSKGLEADVAIITGVFGGTVGFPTSIQDDAILSLAIAEEERFPHAEERRLFYVALTRGKREVHILASNTNISPFTKELEENKYEVTHHYKDNIKPRECPECKLGMVVMRDGAYGKFWGCSNYGKTKCDYKEHIHFCKENNCSAIMQLDKAKQYYQCTNDNCKAREKACPMCSAKLVMRFNKRQNMRPFMGCSNFGRTECRYTEDV